MTTMFTGNQIIADIEFDAVTSEAHSMEATATQYAVDGGGKVSDHITVLPDGLEIRGGISNADGGERARTLIADLPELGRLDRTGGCARRHCGTADRAILDQHRDLNGGVAS